MDTRNNIRRKRRARKRMRRFNAINNLRKAIEFAANAGFARLDVHRIFQRTDLTPEEKSVNVAAAVAHLETRRARLDFA